MKTEKSFFLPYTWMVIMLLNNIFCRTNSHFCRLLFSFFVLFLPFSNVQKGHHRTVQMYCITSCCTTTYQKQRNVAKKRSVTSLWRVKSAACISKGKECHKTVLKYSGSVLLQWEITGKSIVVHKCLKLSLYSVNYTSPHHPLISNLNWQVMLCFMHNPLCALSFR